MRKVTTCIACLFVLVLVFSCKQNQQSTAAAKPVLLENRSIQQKKGTDCDKQPDSLRTDCATIDFTVQKIQGAGAQSALGKSMTAWADKFLIRLLTWTDYDEPGKGPKTVDAAIQRFRAIHDESEGSVASGQFVANCLNSELLNDGKYLTLQLDGYSFLGGNRALHEFATATFDVKTGKQLTWDDLVKDKAALLTLTEASVRASNEEEFSKGFKFDEKEPLALPSAYGLTTDGILMCYQPDEIYGLGSEMVFTIFYDELANNLKVAAPVAPANDAATDASDIYKAQGDSLVIPTFEIEVSNSPKAAKALMGKKASVIVSAYFAGYPKDKKDGDSDEGAMSILTKEITLTGDNQIARFEGLKFSKKTYVKLAPDDKDISVAINIYSEQSSSKDNLLDCGLLEMKASNVENKRYVLGCKLVGEAPKGGTGPTVDPIACYALPPAEELKRETPSFLVDCDSVGNISFAETPMKDLDALKAALRPLLKDWIKDYPKNLPGIETEGCMMGNSGAIRDMYEELVTEMGGKAMPTEMGKEDEKINEKKGSNEKPVAKPTSKTTLPKGLAGVYKASGKGCPMELQIVSKDNGYTYLLKEGKKQHTGTLKSEEQNQLIFKGLLGAEPKVEVEGILDDGKIRIQNSGNSANPFTVFKGCDEKYIELAKTSDKAAPKEVNPATPAPAKGGAPVVTLKQNGDMLLNGKAVGDFDQLRKQLQTALLAAATIPDKLELKTVGETGMGARAEVNTIIDEAIKGAKWVRKKAAIAALNTSVGKKLGTSTQLDLGTYQTSGNFAYVSAKPKQADGKAMDYSKTSYAKEAAAGKHADNAIGLLQYDKGAWKVLTYSLGVTKAPVDAWVKNYKAPKALFGK